jgi:hypothetical protein
MVNYIACIEIIGCLLKTSKRDLDMKRNREENSSYKLRCKNPKENADSGGRWWLEGGSRKRASYSEILERRWRHTLQARLRRRGKTLTPPHLQPVQSIPTSR